MYPSWCGYEACQRIYQQNVILRSGGICFSFAGIAKANLALATNDCGLLFNTQIREHQVRSMCW